MSAKSLAMSAAGYKDPTTYIEDVFSTYLYTGNGSTQTINNGIDLAGKGGMVWLKTRSGATTMNNIVSDTQTGIQKFLITNDTTSQGDAAGTFISSVSNTGFSIGVNQNTNTSGALIASWTFRKAPKFFDVVTYTGNGAVRTLSHSLGQAPGMIVIKATNDVQDWIVYHRSLGATKAIYLNSTSTGATLSTFWNNTEPTSSQFTLGAYAGHNAAGINYVAYLFAHDTTTDGLIQCGSYTTDGSGNATINLGWEPQYLMFKPASTAGAWIVVDSMRGFPSGASAIAAQLRPNESSAESTIIAAYPTATGFVSTNFPNTTLVYMAIRRGPMRTPTDGTKVFSVSSTQTAGGYPSVGPNKGTDTCFDALINTQRSTTGSGGQPLFADRLRGIGQSSTLLTGGTTSSTPYLSSASTLAEVSTSPVYLLTTGSYYINSSIDKSTMYGFKRAPGFFDVVCYTGTGVNNNTVNHNLTVIPELIIARPRNFNSDWTVGNSTVGWNYYLNLNRNIATQTTPYYPFGTLPPTKTAFYVSSSLTNNSGTTHVAYLFASCPGVSKVGSYTGNGSSQTINCGFTNGARFVLIKRTDSTGDWYVWDTSRGIVAATDPHLSLNTTAAEVTTDDTIDPDASGFIVNQVAATNVNVNAATYIFLAVA